MKLYTFNMSVIVITLYKQIFLPVNYRYLTRICEVRRFDLVKWSHSAISLSS